MRYLYGYGYLVIVFVVVTVLKKLFSLQTEISRKLVHIGIGYTWVILYRYFILPENVPSWELLVMPVSFIIINYLSYQYKIFSLVEREGDENHPGTVYYAVAMTLLLLLTIPFPVLVIPSGIAVFALSLGDGFAALFGTLFGKYGPHIRKEKSLVGSAACAVGAMAGTYLLMLFVPFALPFYAVFLIGVTTAVCELVGHGFDNFSILFGVTAVATLLLEVTA